LENRAILSIREKARLTLRKIVSTALELTPLGTWLMMSSLT
jgi:hypothetical protein